MVHGRLDDLVSVMPGRRLVVSSLLAAVSAGSLLGLVLGVIPSSPAPLNAAAPVPRTGPDPTVAPPAPAAADPAAASTSDSTAAPSVSTVTPTPDAAPTVFVADPWNRRSMELVRIEDVKRNDQGVTIKVKRAKLLRGAAARAYYSDKGQAPQDVAVADPGGRTVRYSLRDGAVIFGQSVLGGGDNPQPRPLSLDEFVGVAKDALSHDEHPAVWLQLGNGNGNGNDDGGPVIYLAEQYPA